MSPVPITVRTEIVIIVVTGSARDSVYYARLENRLRRAITHCSFRSIYYKYMTIIRTNDFFQIYSIDAASKND